MNIEEVENDAESTIKLECVKSYKGIYDLGYGRFHPYNYKKGDILERSKIFLKTGHWKIFETN